MQLTAEPAAATDDVVALAARVAKLEQVAASGPVAPAAAPPPRDPATGRAELGGRARRAAASGATPPAGTARPEPRRTAAPTPAPAPVAPAPAPTPAVAEPAAGGDLAAEWEQHVRPTLKGIVRALFTPVDVLAGTGDTVTMAAPNATHRDKCDQHRAAVEQAWAAATGRQVQVELTVGGAPPDAAAARPPAPAEPDEAIDLDDLVDAPPGSAPSALDRLAEAFPGAELVERSER